MCTANRNVSAAVNSAIEFKCSPECTSDISWSYMSPVSSSPRLKSRPLLTPACLEIGRCQVQNSTATGGSLSIDQVQFEDAGTYLCSSGTKDQPDYCEMSFNFTGNFLCISKSVGLRLKAYVLLKNYSPTQSNLIIDMSNY